MTMVNDPELGEAAVYVRDHPELVVIRDSQSLNLISSELFSKHAPLSVRKKVRAAHKEWHRVQREQKFGEWPIKTTKSKLAPDHKVFQVKGRIGKLEYERRRIDEELAKWRRILRSLPQVD